MSLSEEAPRPAHMTRIERILDDDKKFNKALKKIFHAVDANGNGELEKEELFMVVRQLDEELGLDTTDKELEQIWEVLDEDGDGGLTMKEFGPLYRHALETKLAEGQGDMHTSYSRSQSGSEWGSAELSGTLRGERILTKPYKFKKAAFHMFRKFSSDGSALTMGEMVEVVHYVGGCVGVTPATDKDTLAAFFKDMDVDEDGVVSFEEFCPFYREFVMHMLALDQGDDFSSYEDDGSASF